MELYWVQVWCTVNCQIKARVDITMLEILIPKKDIRLNNWIHIKKYTHRGVFCLPRTYNWLPMKWKSTNKRIEKLLIARDGKNCNVFL